MDNKELQYENFMNEVNPIYREFVTQIHDFFLQNGCKIKVELAKSGYVVSYSHTKTKRVVANFVFRKHALVMRIYGDHVNKYLDFMETLPEGMIQSIEKSSVCKRLVNPEACNPKCIMGNDFTIKGAHYQKCRYGSFMFEVNDESIPFIKTFIEYEVKERTA